MVAQERPPAIHIHQLPRGEIVRSIHYHDLGLREYDQLNGVNVTLLLHVAVGGIRGAPHFGSCTKWLRTYKVECSFFLKSRLLFSNMQFIQ